MTHDVQPVRFTGTTGDYFKIWIVNLLLSIVTLGIWSAWAKVRTKKYFYGHTHLAGSSFDYDTTGWVILKGRLIAFAIIAVWTVVTSVFPPAYFIGLPALLFLLPWIINRGTRFNARITRWRNVRFDFVGNYWKCFAIYMLAPMTLLISGGFSLPWIRKISNQYYIDNHRFGSVAFSLKADLGDFFVAYLKMMLLGVVVGLCVAVVAVPIGFAVYAMADSYGAGGDDTVAAVIVVAYIGVLLAAGVVFPYFEALILSLTLNGMSLDGGHRFACDLSGWRYIGLHITNTLAVLFSLGLAMPWATIRLYRYIAESVTALPGDNLDAFVDTQAKETGVVSAEFMDLEGISVGI